MSVILIADKNSTWLELHRQAILELQSRNWTIVSVGLDSSGLHAETEDYIIYQEAASKGWFIVSRDNDFFEVARTAKARNQTMTDVLIVPDALNHAKPIFKSISDILSFGHKGETADIRVSRIEEFVSLEILDYMDASSQIVIAKAKKQAIPSIALSTVAAYIAKYEIDLKAEKIWRRQQKKKQADGSDATPF